MLHSLVSHEHSMAGAQEESSFPVPNAPQLYSPSVVAVVVVWEFFMQHPELIMGTSAVRYLLDQLAPLQYFPT